MRTDDGGETWDDLLATPATLARYLPVEQFPTEKSLLESIVSAELRPASRTAVYLTVRYHPYESVHVYDFEAAKADRDDSGCLTDHKLKSMMDVLP